MSREKANLARVLFGHRLVFMEALGWINIALFVLGCLLSACGKSMEKSSKAYDNPEYQRKAKSIQNFGLGLILISFFLHGLIGEEQFESAPRGM